MDTNNSEQLNKPIDRSLEVNRSLVNVLGRYSRFVVDRGGKGIDTTLPRDVVDLLSRVK